MVQQIRLNEPRYICVIPVDTITGNPDEEIMTFGVSTHEVKKQGEQLLASTYGCNDLQILELMQQARVEPIAEWCATGEQ